MSASESDIQNLREAVRDLVGSEPSILGSTLGFALRRKVPQLDIKHEFGSLDSFITRFCPDILSRSIQPGGHLAYVNRSIGESLGSVGLLTPNLWQAFVNPRSTAHIYVDSNVPRLFASNDEQPDLQAVPRLTIPDHQGIARAFYSQLDQGKKERLKDEEQKGFEWSSWRKAINFDRGLVRSWSEFRTEAIVQLLRDRLGDFALDDQDISKLINQLRASITERSPTGRKPVSRRQADISHHTSGSFRRKFMDAVSSMSDSELAQVWLPAGVLLGIEP